MDWEQELDGDPVLIWRAQRLERAGFNHAQAGQLAQGRDIDLHRAVELLRAVLAKGEPRETAFDILAP